MTSEVKEKPKEGRFVRHSRVVKRLAREPKYAGTLVRDWLVALWATKGGGFYGLGYVVTLVILEALSLEQDAVQGATSVAGAESFVASQAIQYISGFGIDSLMNTIRAVAWPAYLFDWLGPPGIVAFFVAGAVFERIARPAVEARVPELAAARAQRLRAREEKRERKRATRQTR